jgi:hypothetical protein
MRNVDLEVEHFAREVHLALCRGSCGDRGVGCSVEEVDRSQRYRLESVFSLSRAIERPYPINIWISSTL